MVWSLALRSDDAKQDPVVYGTKFGVVFVCSIPITVGHKRSLRGLHATQPNCKTILGSATPRHLVGLLCAAI